MATRYFILAFVIITITSRGQGNSSEIIRKNKINTQKVYASNTLVAIRQFNEDGEIVYASNNNFVASGLLTTHTYVFKDKLKVKDLSTHSSFPGDTTVVTYSYDSLRRLVQRIYQDKGRSFTNYEYDSLGHVVRETKLDSIGEIQVVKLFRYNSLGKEVETISKGKDPNDKRQSYFSKNSVSRTSYDSLGREIKFTVYDRDELTFERIYSYDRKNRLVDEFDSKESRGTRFFYNNKGQITTRYRYKNTFDKKNIVGTEILRYFKNGLIKTFTEDIFNGRSEMRTLSYKYE